MVGKILIFIALWNRKRKIKVVYIKSYIGNKNDSDNDYFVGIKYCYLCLILFNVYDFRIILR